jgi:hypothetical protein
MLYMVGVGCSILFVVECDMEAVRAALRFVFVTLRLFEVRVYIAISSHNLTTQLLISSI